MVGFAVVSVVVVGASVVVGLTVVVGLAVVVGLVVVFGGVGAVVVAADVDASRHLSQNLENHHETHIPFGQHAFC